MAITTIKRAKFVNEALLAKSIDPIVLKMALRYAAMRRSESRMGNRGFSKDKEIMSVSAIPRDVYWHPSIRQYINSPDEKERIRLLREMPAFMTRDHL
jgi:hypothetical protein